MGTNFSNPILVYGVIINNPYGADDILTDDGTSWYRDDDDDYDYGDQALLHLLTTFGHTPDHAPDIDRAAREHLGLHIQPFGHADEPGHILATHTFQPEPDEPSLPVDPAWMAEQADNGEWDNTLLAAVAALGIYLSAPAPRWHLTTYHYH